MSVISVSGRCGGVSPTPDSSIAFACNLKVNLPGQNALTRAGGVMLDIFPLGGRSTPEYTVSDYSALESGFRHLVSLTGVYIDPYGNTRLYPDHQRLLISYWKDNDHPEVRRLSAYLEEGSSREITLMFEGD